MDRGGQTSPQATLSECPKDRGGQTSPQATVVAGECASPRPGARRPVSSGASNRLAGCLGAIAVGYRRVVALRTRLR
jgi:hypothetical protein